MTNLYCLIRNNNVRICVMSERNENFFSLSVIDTDGTTIEILKCKLTYYSFFFLSSAFKRIVWFLLVLLLYYSSTLPQALGRLFPDVDNKKTFWENDLVIRESSMTHEKTQ